MNDFFNRTISGLSVRKTYSGIAGMGRSLPIVIFYVANQFSRTITLNFIYDVTILVRVTPRLTIAS